MMANHRVLTRRLVLAVVAMSASGILAVPAFAATAPAPASLSDTLVTGSSVRIVLTVPATVDAVSIKPGSVAVTVGGKPVAATVSQVQQESRSAFIVIDTSGSMGGPGIAAATQAARAYLSVVPPDVRVGLVTFSDTAHLLVPATQDRAVVARMLPGLKAQGETALYDGLMVALNRLGSTGSRSLILLSDGADTVSKSGLAATRQAINTAGVRVEAVGFHTADSQDSVLASLASAGGGRLLRAGNAGALASAFRAAATALAGQVRLVLTVPPGLGGQQPLVVRAVANNQQVQATSTLALPAAGVASPPVTGDHATSPKADAGSLTATAHGSAASIGKSLPLWTAVVFVGLIALGWFVISPLFTPTARKRVQELDGYGGASARKVTKKAAPSAISGQVLQLSDKLIEGRESTARSALLLERADLPLRVNEWYVLRVVAVVVAFTLSWLLLRGSVLGTIVAIVLGVVLGILAPAVFLRVAANRRACKFESQLPDTLTLMASSLSTGFSLPQAIDAVVRDAAQPTAKEFGRALAETRIGADLEDSLDRLAHRTGSTNLEWTTMAIRIQRQVGGSLAETLRTTASTLRERESLRRHVQALSADGRLSAYILIALPIGLFFYMYWVDRPYLAQLWTTGMGLVMSAFGVVVMVIGIFWMRKTVEVRV
jgi:tight adherence protein B